MANKHCFDFYTVRVRRKRQNSYEQLRSIGDNETDLFLMLSSFFNALTDFRDDETNKTLALRDGEPQTDNKQHLLYGFVKSGAYGTASELVNRRTRNSTSVTEDDANVFKFFYCFYLPPNSTTGALVMHKIGVHGVYSLMRQQLFLYFKEMVNDALLEIEPVYFNLAKSRKFSLTKLEVVLSRKRTATGKASSNDVSPHKRIVGRCAIELGHDPSFIKQLFNSTDAKTVALDKINPFFVVKKSSYDVTVNAKVKMDGLNKTVKIQNKFQYNTSVDKSDDLKYQHGYPTLDSLYKEAVASFHMLKENGQI